MARPGPPKLRERAPRPFVLDGEELVVRVHESSRARVSRLVVGPRRPLEIVVPRRVTNAEIDRILDARRAWIRAQHERLRELATAPGALGLRRSGFAALGGMHVPILRAQGVRPGAELRAGRLVVSGPREQAGNAVARWYREEARRRIGALAASEAARLDLRFGTLAIRDQRTRWGSCSSTGTLSFNWRLVLAPRRIAGYVVVHELCHLREPNHSRRFWGHVEGALPGWRADADWLREHAEELHAYDPAALA